MSRPRLVVAAREAIDVRAIAAPLDGALARLRADGAEAALLVAPLAGEAVAIGRFQRVGSTIDVALPHAPIVRRASGGSAIAVRAGQLYVALDLASPTALGGVADPARILNRHVRPLLRALQSQGVRAVYGGRDFIACRGVAIAWVGVRHEVATGRTGVEMVVALDRAFNVDATLDLSAGAIEPRFGGRAPGSIAALLGRSLTVDAILRAIVECYSAVADANVSTRALELPATDPPLTVDEPPFDALIEVPIGLLGVSISNARIALGGDWMVSHDAVAALERDLASLLAEFGNDGVETDACVARALTDRLGPASGALVFGVRGLEPVQRLITLARTKMREARS